MNPRRRVAVFVAIAFLGITGGRVLKVSAVPERQNPIVQENSRTGNGQWTSAHLQTEIVKGPPIEAELPPLPSPTSRIVAPGGGTGVIPNSDVDNTGSSPVIGWADAQSVNQGQTLGLHISSKAATYDISIYRMGWYNGAGGRLLASAANLVGVDRGKPTPDATTGLIETTWPTSYTVTTDATWTSGVYLAQLVPSAGGVAGYIPFVVRNDASTAAIVYQVPFNTYQAYNGWGGKSLYNFNSTGGAAVKVSYDRPYLAEDGAGNFFDGDYSAIRFLEREGVDITYVSSNDTATNASLMNNHKAFTSYFHDEYWSGNQRRNLESFIRNGKNVAFFSANNVYWQVRFEADSVGRAGRTMVGYKNPNTDPVAATNPTDASVRFRDALLNRPENGLLGAMYEGDFTFGDSVPWTVTNASNFVYTGTGLNNGDQIARLVGYEYDRLFNNGLTPAGVIQLSDSPITIVSPDVPAGDPRQQATIYQAPSGAYVFNASTTYWPRLLDTSVDTADTRVQQMTRNLLTRFSVLTPPPPPPTTTTTTTTVPATPTTTTVPATTTTTAVPATTTTTAVPATTTTTVVPATTTTTVPATTTTTAVPATTTTTVVPATTTTTVVPPTGPRATQSSTAFGGAPERAIDGNIDGTYSHGSISHTGYQNRPWWQVDLGSSQPIPSVIINNRTDCCSDRLSNFTVYVSATPFGSDPDTQAGVTKVVYGGTVGAVATIATNATGRFIRVQLNGTNYLSLAEVRVGAALPVSCNSGEWKAEYFANRTLSGSPALIRCESSINNNWGSGSPDVIIPSDNFSVRWTTTQSFNFFTRYTYTTVSDDGIRVSIDGRSILNNWTDHGPTTNYRSVYFVFGKHQVVVEYYEAGGGAVAKVQRSPN